jgi:hypothetical protein
VIAGAVSQAGTYLASEDLARLGVHRGSPKLRLYGFGDTLNKVFSKRGFVYLLTILLGTGAALFGVYLALWGKTGPTATTVADRAQAALRWADAPADRLDASVRSSQVPAVRRAIHGRFAAAARCLTLLRGGQAPAASVPDVQCHVTSPHWWQDPATGPLIAITVGALTALLGFAGVGDKFGFRKTP